MSGRYHLSGDLLAAAATLTETEYTNRCRAAALRAGATTLEKRAAFMPSDAGEYRVLAERLSPQKQETIPMSYSFSVTADSKAEVATKVADEFAKVVEGQPAHEADRQAAQAAVEAMVGVLADPGSAECVYVSVSGSLSWRDGEQKVFTNASVSVTAYLTEKAQAADPS